MVVLEIREARWKAPNVRMVSSEVWKWFVAWFRAGVGLGVAFFLALTTLSALSHGADWIQGTTKEDRQGKLGVTHDLVIPKISHVLVPRVLQSGVGFQKREDDYRILHEQNRLMTDLMDNLSRTVSRFAR